MCISIVTFDRTMLARWASCRCHLVSQNADKHQASTCLFAILLIIEQAVRGLRQIISWEFIFIFTFTYTMLGRILRHTDIVCIFLGLRRTCKTLHGILLWPHVQPRSQSTLDDGMNILLSVSLVGLLFFPFKKKSCMKYPDSLSKRLNTQWCKTYWRSKFSHFRR